MGNVKKSPCSGKGFKAKGAANKGATIRNTIDNEGGSRQYYRPQRILMDSRVQLLMLDKVAMEGLRLTNDDLEPCPY
jgi:hypothetical protein